jgi:PAS domain S-box-containing protein
MNATQDVWSMLLPPRPQWDTLLRLLPSHLFLFDEDLICRYAAPYGEGFLGQPSEHLVGRHAAEVLPPARNGLRPALERAVRESEAWSTAEHRYRHPGADGEQLYVWAIHIQPFPLDGHRAVLVTLHDVQEITEAQEQLRSEVRTLEATLARAHAEAQERGRAMRSFLARARTLLTTIWGYLQIMSRRPYALRGRPATSVVQDLVLPQIESLIETIDELDPALRAESAPWHEQPDPRP